MESKFLFSIDGEISVNVNNVTLAEIFDDDPLAIEYVSFASLESAPNRYFYDCPQSKNSIFLKQIRNSVSRVQFSIRHGYSLLLFTIVYFLTNK